MPNSCPEWRNFQFTPHNHYRFFFLHTLPSAIVFKLGSWICVILLILCANKYIFYQEMFGSARIYDILLSCTRSSFTPWYKTIFGSARIYDVLLSCIRSSYTPWYETEISRTSENHGKSCCVISRKVASHWKSWYVWTLSILIKWASSWENVSSGSATR